MLQYRNIAKTFTITFLVAALVLGESITRICMANWKVDTRCRIVGRGGLLAVSTRVGCVTLTILRIHATPPVRRWLFGRG
jgi:hypothetical protein